ncbi:hypothetical protein AMAG_20776 [Allomyces macrogynus ATCC 38327]|uniref:Uncharacterized protein n=1 Tax=Allomyces macrogynus (strain ATCC 38327) TaxID=578462 RepID=A0A0L0TFJ3_ALLM3|nr:hypothetical protein AMAG_20776 [Allomyces macrogynus ATCC 38327]|eukprot:KNE73384.1 hypothetical protein AMAG_20776 [Allomyces macrogynus ATCC 38327]
MCPCASQRDAIAESPACLRSNVKAIHVDGATMTAGLWIFTPGCECACGSSLSWMRRWPFRVTCTGAARCARQLRTPRVYVHAHRRRRCAPSCSSRRRGPLPRMALPRSLSSRRVDLGSLAIRPGHNQPGHRARTCRANEPLRLVRVLSCTVPQHAWRALHDARTGARRDHAQYERHAPARHVPGATLKVCCCRTALCCTWCRPLNQPAAIPRRRPAGRVVVAVSISRSS